ncbi:MAG TPA: hypothetical protein VMN76_01940 [Acidobacteriota bacterium]|nr:hypothetical protein [Acidobacteriota bacterium]
MMMKRIAVLVLAVLFFTTGFAQEGVTWETQEPIWDVTSIRIYPNAGQQYLNNLRRTWVSAMEESKKLGLISDYKILSSLTNNGPGYNLLLIVHYPNLAAMDATSALRAKWKQLDEKMQEKIPTEESQEISLTVYPNLREIENQQLMRELKFK